jgi:hypothetical protein
MAEAAAKRLVAFYDDQQMPGLMLLEQEIRTDGESDDRLQRWQRMTYERNNDVNIVEWSQLKP